MYLIDEEHPYQESIAANPPGHEVVATDAEHINEMINLSPNLNELNWQKAYPKLYRQATIEKDLVLKPMSDSSLHNPHPDSRQHS